MCGLSLSELVLAKQKEQNKIITARLKLFIHMNFFKIVNQQQNKTKENKCKKVCDGTFIPSAPHMITIVSLDYCPNGGASQVCATEFDQDGNGLRESAGC
jgi:hypothetical protein